MRTGSAASQPCTLHASRMRLACRPLHPPCTRHARMHPACTHAPGTAATRQMAEYVTRPRSAPVQNVKLHPSVLYTYGS
jgi:hypothetical protein